MNLRDMSAYIPQFLKIRTKSGALAPLRPKPAQQMLLDIIRRERAAGRPPRILILKARQLGLSTITVGVMFHDSVTGKLVQTLIVAHRDDSTTKLFRMNKLFYDCLPRKLQPMCKHSNAKELVFENPTRNPDEKRKRPGLMSSIRCVTANDGMGRSETLNNVHLSEFAFWKGNKNEILDGVMQSVPADVNTLVVIESTANGYNEFKDLWDGAVAGTNGWVPLFIAWFHEAAGGDGLGGRRACPHGGLSPGAGADGLAAVVHSGKLPRGQAEVPAGISLYPRRGLSLLRHAVFR